MAMVLRTVRPYIPLYGDNRKKSKEEQVVAYLKNIDIKKRQEQLRKFMKTKPDDLMDQLMEEQQSTEIREILKDNVVRFENLKIDDGQTDEKGEPRLRDCTIQDLFSMGEWMLCIELFMNIVQASQLTKEQEKNSESQSGSTPLLHEGEVVGTVQ